MFKKTKEATLEVKHKPVPDSVITQLETLTEKLHSFPNAGCNLSQAEGLCYELERGTCLAWNLMNIPAISIAKEFISKDSRFQVHKHDYREWIIVYQGSMEMEDDKGKHLLATGDFLVLEANVPHSAICLEDCWFIAITIPQSPEWPK